MKNKRRSEHGIEDKNQFDSVDEHFKTLQTNTRYTSLLWIVPASYVFFGSCKMRDARWGMGASNTTSKSIPRYQQCNYHHNNDHYQSCHLIWLLKLLSDMAISKGMAWYNAYLTCHLIWPFKGSPGNGNKMVTRYDHKNHLLISAITLLPDMATTKAITWCNHWSHSLISAIKASLDMATAKAVTSYDPYQTFRLNESIKGITLSYHLM